MEKSIYIFLLIMYNSSIKFIFFYENVATQCHQCRHRNIIPWKIFIICRMAAGRRSSRLFLSMIWRTMQLLPSTPFSIKSRLTFMKTCTSTSPIFLICWIFNYQKSPLNTHLQNGRNDLSFILGVYYKKIRISYFYFT